MDPLVALLRSVGCVFASEEARILTEAADGDAERLEKLVAARVSGLPLEPLVGWVELDGSRWSLAPGVFVPRQRSELLIKEAFACAKDGKATRTRTVRLVDLCCGCGALGGAVAARLLAAGHPVDLHATDIDPVAVSCAAYNLSQLTHRKPAHKSIPFTSHTYRGDLADALPADLHGHVDVVMANAPYVPSHEITMMPPEARDYEPHIALDGGDDGLVTLRRVIDLAPTLLRPNGYLFIEIGKGQVNAAMKHIEGVGFTATMLADDALGATALAATLSTR